ncbi:hypothetical protein SAMN04487938_4043 [Lysobacter sp. cf310]|nr:hypothetical protein SAMN04487938_4043 [Lysobacter sp. cf310]
MSRDRATPAATWSRLAPLPHGRMRLRATDSTRPGPGAAACLAGVAPALGRSGASRDRATSATTRSRLAPLPHGQMRLRATHSTRPGPGAAACLGGVAPASGRSGASRDRATSAATRSRLAPLLQGGTAATPLRQGGTAATTAAPAGRGCQRRRSSGEGCRRCRRSSMRGFRRRPEAARPYRLAASRAPALEKPRRRPISWLSRFAGRFLSPALALRRGDC